MPGKLNILYVTPEVAPFARASSLADVAGSLPKYVKELGHDIRVMMPNYKIINERKYTLRDVIRLQGIEIPVGKQTFVANGKSSFIPNTKVQVYFLDNKDFFDRDDLFTNGHRGEHYEDNAERFAFFCRGCLETLKLLHWQPDIIHCNDWQTALIPLLLKSVYREDAFFSQTRTFLSVHTLRDPGIFERDALEEAGLNRAWFAAHEDGDDRPVSLLKAGMEHANLIGTVSGRQAREIWKRVVPESRVAEALERRKDDFVEIPYGVDYEVWHPDTDRLITQTYGRRSLTDKRANKEALLERLGLPAEPNKPVLGLVAWANDAPGFDLFCEAADDLLGMDVVVAVVGTREPKQEKFFSALHKRHPKKFAFEGACDDRLLHWLFAGSDLYLLPARDEPCTLYAMYAMKYGTIPVAYENAAMVEVVRDAQSKAESGMGFVFSNHKRSELTGVVKKALKQYGDEEAWLKLMQSAMKEDFSSRSVATKQVKHYQKLVNTRSK